MNILAIIPARGGSKGLPKKNMKKLNGIPLIEHTIRIAKQSKKINKIIVSTDDKQIAQISKSLKVEVPFLRPKSISKDSSPSIEYVKHAISYLLKNESYEPDIIIILQPTSPFRSKSLIDDSIKMLQKTNSSSVISVSTMKKHPYLSFENTKNYLKPVKKNFQKFYQRQKFPTLFYPTGSIYTFWYDTLKKFDSIYGPKIKPLIIKTHQETLDIDDLFDFFLAEMTSKYWTKYQKKS